MLIILLCIGYIGIIDVDQNHMEDMAEIVDGEVTGILVKNHEEIAIALMGLIILEVDVIAIPLQMWRYDSGIARMVAVANHMGIRVIVAGTDNKWYCNDFLERLIGKTFRYVGVEYVDRSFRRSASENTIRKARHYDRITD